MAGTSSSQVRSAYVAETTAGATPATPAFTTSHRPIMMQARPRPVDHPSLTAGGARLGHAIDQIEVAGQIQSAPFVYGAFDTWFETLMQGAWTSDVLKDGKSIKTVTVENAFPAGVGGTTTMLRYLGVEATGGTLALQAEAAAQLSLTLAGRGSSDGSTTAITGATYTDPDDIDPLSSGADVGAITFGGYTLDCMASAQINFAFTGRDRQPRLGTNTLCGITRGAFQPTITAEFYVEANFMAILNAARDRTTSTFAVTFPLGSVSGEKYTLEFPSCVFGPTEIDMSGASLMQSVEIRPQYSTDDDCVAILTRAVS